LDATQVASDIAGGKITAFKAMQNALSKAKEYRNLGAIVKIESEAALAQAKKADETLKNIKVVFMECLF
jgi:Asp-tRNA(Asn)/Glu-tRNA(Gln) amidotransferase A subunit family amidase